MSLRTKNIILLLFFALLCQPALAATSWSYRLPATKDAIDAKTQASFRLNCGKQQQKIQHQQ